MVLIEALRRLDEIGRFVFSKHELHKMFIGESYKTFSEGLSRAVKAGILVRASNGVYVNENSKSKDSYMVEHVAKVLRRGFYNYVSLESILSEYGIISQIPLDRLTVMTTGRKGVYKTPYGIIEFTHTSRKVSDILDSTIKTASRPLRVATKKAAVRDLRRVGRNVNLIIME